METDTDNLARGKSRRILLLGHDGQIGSRLAPLLAREATLVTASYPDIDFADAGGLRQLVRRTAPELIVNAAGYTAVDAAETDAATAQAVNADGPRILAEEALALEAGLVHYSTDFVFDGTKGAPYVETDTPHPLSVYGASKWTGDQAVLQSGCLHLIFRVSWVYGLTGRNFLLTMQRLGRERDELRVVDDQVGCPTWSGAVTQATATVLETLHAAADWRTAWREHRGLYNMVCSGETSWCGFARAILPTSVRVVPITTADYPTPAKRPTYSPLDCSKLRDTFGVTMPSWEAGLTQCLAEKPAAPAP